MKLLTTWVCSFCLVAIFLLGGPMRSESAQSKNPGSTQPSSFGKQLKMIFQSMFRPRDLYADLVNGELDISRQGEVRKFEFKNKYVGKYFIELFVTQFDKDWLFSANKKYDLKVRIEVKFYLGDELIASHILGKEYSPAVGRTGGSFILESYQCPEDLPIGKSIVCEVKVTEPDPYLSNNYGPIRFVIRKVSDE